MKTVGINGFGRIGRTLTRLLIQNQNFDVALVNDVADIETLAHLLKYDSVHGIYQTSFEIRGNSLIFENGKTITFVSEKDPAQIPWAAYQVETVIDCTGLFLSKEKASQHFKGGAKRIILSAPAKDETKTIVMGVNDSEIAPSDRIISNASCTTNCAAPMLKVIQQLATIEVAYVNTIHSFTSDQRIHDAPHSDLRRARTASSSIIPTTTGAAQALCKIFPELNDKLNGGSIRVPVSDGSITEITLYVDRELSVEEINATFRKEAESTMKGIIRYIDEPVVSVDIIGDRNSVIFDSLLTNVLGRMVKIVGWYDNEMGYSARLMDLAEKF